MERLTTFEWPCSNEVDYITQDSWNQQPPEVMVTFIGRNGRSFVNCYSFHSLTKWMDNRENYFSPWVPHNPDIPMDAIGHGGGPNLAVSYLKLFTQEYLLNGDDLIDKNTYVHFTATYTGKVRLGNQQGIFGVSSLHGQAPGEDTYKITAWRRYNTEESNAVVRHYMQQDDASVPYMHTARVLTPSGIYEQWLRKAATEALFASQDYRRSLKYDDTNTMMDLLIKYYLYIDFTPADTQALYYAVTLKMTELAQVLLAIGVPPVGRQYMQQPLTTAIEAGNSEIIPILLRYGALPLRSDFDLATRLCNQDVIRELWKSGAY